MSVRNGTVVCDRCGKAESTGFDADDEVRRHLDGFGWTVRPVGRERVHDLCPRCSTPSQP